MQARYLKMLNLCAVSFWNRERTQTASVLIFKCKEKGIVTVSGCHGIRQPCHL